MTTNIIEPELKTVLRRLKLSRLLDTMSERLSMARQQKLPHQDFLMLLLGDEVSRRDAMTLARRGQRAHLEPDMHFERWDETAQIHYDRELLNELISLRFVEARQHVALIGPVGVGKTFLAHALGHAACSRGYSVLQMRADRMLKTLRHCRLDNSHEVELRKMLSVDLLIID